MLGRGVVLNRDQPVPAAWRDAPVHLIDEAVLAEPGAVVDALHRAWVSRTPVVIRLAVDPARFRDPVSYAVEPWTVAASFEPSMDRLHFLVWANTHDGRADPEHPVWWWSRKAARLTGVSELPADQAGDVLLADGQAAWIDGGPRAPFSPHEVDGLAVVHRESIELGRVVVAPALAAASQSPELAPDQLAAVGHRSGPARIIAPAGSGKTRVLTDRLRHLITERGYERDLVLAVAYNKKAQEELESRCAAFRPRVRTLNSLGYWLVARARGSSPPVLEEREVRRLIEKLVPIRRLRANTDPIGPYVEALSLVRLGLRDPEEVEASRDDVPGLAGAFGPYRAALRDLGAVDFDEQVYGAIEALLVDGGFRRQAQAGCRHLLVDEFQDLTPAHVLMLRLLAVPQLDVFGVGDDDQVIYGHAGADPGFLISFERFFPGAGAHALEVNYRCPTVVVERAAMLLSYNERRVAKAIRPGPAACDDAGALRVVWGGAVELVSVVSGWFESGVSPSDVAVLARVNALLLAPQVALAEAGIPVVSALRSDVLERTGLRAALAYLRIAVAPAARIAAADVVEVLRRPSRGLPQWFPDRLRRRSWWSIDQLAAIADAVPAKEASKVDRLVGDLSAVRRAASLRGASTRSLLTAIKDEIGLGGAMGLLDRSAGGEGSSHLDDLEALSQVAGLHPAPATFEGWLRSALSAPARAADDGVVLSTVHRVKGMEWERVAVYGVNAGIVPHRLAEDEEEERRVLHVALTRCKREVVVLADQSRPSPMLAELDGSAVRRPAGRVAAERAAAERARSASASASASAREAPLSGDAAAAETALRAWRLERCRRDHISAFIVLYDRTLKAIAAKRPTTLVELSRIDGIGPTKLELYGDEILGVLSGLDA